MSKRTASVQLTANSVDEQDGIAEEAGAFEVASQEEIQQRVIKKAKRGRSTEQVASGAGGIFANLQNSLGSASTLSSSASREKGLFQFSGSTLASAPLKLGASTKPPPEGPTPSSATIKLGLGSGSGSTTFGPGSGSTLVGSGSSSAPKFGLGTSAQLGFGTAQFGSGPSGSGPSGNSLFRSGPFGSNPHRLGATASAPINLGGASTNSSQFGFKVPHTTEYLEQLSSLNRSVSQWISKHVSTNPYVDLRPIFRDYETHLTDIDAKYTVGLGETESRQGSLDVVMEGSSEGSSEPRNESEGSSGSSSTAGEVISLSGSTPRDSPDVTSSMPSTTTPTPPPSNVTSPPDDDSLLTVRAKLFYKKGSEFVDLGVGSLKVQSSTKSNVHLLMRNDTSLGTVLLNVKVSGEMPVSCSKKSVFIVCPAPNPPLSVGEGPVTYLLRVKTAELAEQLLKVIQDNTKA